MHWNNFKLKSDGLKFIHGFCLIEKSKAKTVYIYFRVLFAIAERNIIA